MSYIPGVSTVVYDNGPTLDAFGRLRVSPPQTIFDSKQIFDKQPLLWDDVEESGSGTTSTHNADRAGTTLAVGASAGTRTRQTFMRFNYQPGKSQLVMMTCILDKSGGGQGIQRSLGLFDDNNGLFFHDDVGTVKVVRRTNVTGTPVDNEVAQSSWNVDPMDGTGPSGITADWSKTQIFSIDFEWLGVGRVRMGLVIEGMFHTVHEFLNANVLDAVYMSTPNLPLRYQIINDGFGSAASMEALCGTVISEGGQYKNGVLRYASTRGTHVDANADGTLYAIIGIRLKSAYIGETIDLVSVSLSEQQGSKTSEWVLLLNPTVDGTFTYSDQTNSAVQIATGASTNTISALGTQIAGGHFSSGNRGGSAGEALENALHLGAAIDGTVDEIVLAAGPVGSTNADIEGGIEWREVS